MQDGSCSASSWVFLRSMILVGQTSNFQTFLEKRKVRPIFYFNIYKKVNGRQSWHKCINSVESTNFI